MDIIAEFSTSDNKWTQLGHLNNKRSGHSAIILNDDIYVIGGQGQRSIEKCTSYGECQNLDTLLDYAFYPELFTVGNDYCEVQ